jgi:membrane protein implicated in regulation of membrane protease activity
LADPIQLTIGLFLVILGIVLLGIEVVHPGVFLLIPAGVVIASGLLYLFLPYYLLDTIWGPAVVIVVAFVAAIATVPYYQRIAPIHKPMSTTPDALEGEIGLVVAPVVPDSLSGKVRVRSEIWSARSDRNIPVGTKVRIMGGEGVSVRVQPVDATTDAAPVPGATS